MWTKQVCCDKGHNIKGLKFLKVFKLSLGVNSQTLNVTFVVPTCWLSHLITTAGYLVRRLVKVNLDKVKLNAPKVCL